MSVSLYEIPAFEGLPELAEDTKTNFVLTGAAATRVAILATFFPERLEQADLVDLCPFMERLELEITTNEQDLRAVAEAFEARIAWGDLANVSVSRLEEGDRKLSDALPLLRTRITKDGFDDGDHVIDKSQDGVVRFASSIGLPSPSAAARALALCADLSDFFGMASLDDAGRQAVATLGSATSAPPIDWTVFYWLKACAGRYGATLGRFLDEQYLDLPLFDFANFTGAAWLADCILGEPMVLSPNLGRALGRTVIEEYLASSLPDPFFDAASVASGASALLTPMQEPVVGLPVFGIVGGERTGLIEISAPVEAEVSGRAVEGGLDAVLFIYNGLDVHEVAMATVPMSIAGGVSADARRAILRVESAALCQAVAEVGPLAFRPYAVKNNPNGQLTPSPTTRQRLNEPTRVQQEEQRRADAERQAQAQAHTQTMKTSR